MCYSTKKKIHFNNIDQIILIPSRNEYDNLMKNKIWWNSYYLYLFRQSAIEDIYKLLQIHPYITTYQAMKLLYQPKSMLLQYDPSNFED
jgi:hypothetical protein